MTPVDDAVGIILNSVKLLQGESVDILDSDSRILYKDIISDIKIPPFDNSAMDGFALISSETSGAAKETPSRFSIKGEIQAGINVDLLNVEPGTAVRIMTGAPMPSGADAVVPVEDTSEESDKVSVFKELKKNENVRFAGEDIEEGQAVLKRGAFIRSADIGLFSSLNLGKVDVFRKPEIAVISTGDEIVDVGEDIKPGQIRNSNAYTLCSEIKKYMGIPHYLGIARDTPGATEEMFNRGFEYDIVITTGGVSMGKYDFVKDVMKSIGVDIKIEKLRMKPGKPMVFGTKGDKLFFGLPGNPVSTMISFNEFVRPVMLKMMGASNLFKPYVDAVLDDDIKKKPGRLNFIRGFFTIKNGSFHVSITGPQGSGILRSMSEANCLVILEEDVVNKKKGDKVKIQLIRHEEI